MNILKPMLAATCDDITKLRFPLLATPKIDGIRVINDVGNLLSRSLKVIPNEFIQRMIGLPEFHGMDGELDLFYNEIATNGPLIPRSSFQEVSSAILSKSGAPNFIYRVFDLMIEDVGYARRMSLLQDMKTRVIDMNILEFFDFLFPACIESLPQLEKYLEERLALGDEGVMVRKPGGSYKHGRSTFNEHGLIKIKPFEDDEAEIVGFEELMHNLNEAGVNALGHTERSTHRENLFGGDTLGALICKSAKWPNVTFKIGTGFDALTRKNIWMSRDICHLKTVKYKFQRIGSLDRPRCPVFLGFRSELDTSPDV